MRHLVDAELRAEASRYALVFGCRRCAHFEERPATCSLGFPVDEHLDVDLAAAAEVVFCKTFEPRVSRSHPPTLLRLAERCAREECGLGRGDVVMVACSGGPDSMALLHVLALLRDRLGIGVAGHGVDHGLRAEAAAELEIAARFADSLQVPFGISRLRVAPGGNLQARAREARHRALQLAAHAAGATVIALGHTADDRAETVLLRLLRGAGPRGLAAMPARVEGEPVAQASPDPAAREPTALPRVRPLLRARRADVLLHLERHRVPSSTDPSNEDPRFLRVRVRREVLPLLAELSPGIVDHLCALADQLATDLAPGPIEPALAAGLPPLGRAQREAIERARRTGRAGARLRLRGGADVTVSFQTTGIVVNPEGDLAGADIARKHAMPKGERLPEAVRARKVPRSTAGGKGGMLVDSEKKGRTGAIPGQARERPKREVIASKKLRPPSRGSS